MIRRELSKIDFLDIGKALGLAAGGFRRDGLFLAAMRCDDLRELFEAAHTSWLEIEEKRQPKH